MSLCKYRVHGAVAVIEMDSPPVNGLGLALRRSLVEHLDRAQSDVAVRAVVLSGNGRGFSAGADIGEFASGGAAVEPSVPTVIRMMDESSKILVAAIDGDCLGGGLELALACHYRVASVGAKVGLPEVSLGLLPAAGGTQRLPRIIGVEAALDLILSGAIARAGNFADTGLFDLTVDSDVLNHALEFAEDALLRGTPPKRVRDRKIDFPQHEAFFQFARNTVRASAKNPVAALRCVDAVQAAVTKSFDQGLDLEKESFVALMRTTESKALRHSFFSQRAAAKLDDLAGDTVVRPVESVAVIGAGTMGTGIAMSFANAGIPVTLLEAKVDALDRGLASIRKNYESSTKKGKLTADQAEARLGLIHGTFDYAEIRNADLVIEAVFEEMSAKEAVFRKLDATLKPGAILATNTSTLDVNQIAAFTKRPEDVVGLHFFSPANIMKLLEIVRGEKTANDVMASVLAVAKKIKKVSVVSGVCFGFIGNRMIERYHQQAIAMLEEGAFPRQIDLALERWGMAMGPFRMSDMAGNDVSWLIRKWRFADAPEQAALYALPDRLCETGRFGQKAGKGWYRYETGSRDAIPDPEVEELIIHRSEELGLTRRKISDEEIVQRCVLAMTNEGAKILEEGIAQRASDIDVVYLTGYGFPSLRGGPMFWADTLGLFNVGKLIRKFADNASPLATQAWTLSPLLLDLAAQGKTFS